MFIKFENQCSIVSADLSFLWAGKCTPGLRPVETCYVCFTLVLRSENEMRSLKRNSFGCNERLWGIFWLFSGSLFHIQTDHKTFASLQCSKRNSRNSHLEFSDFSWDWCGFVLRLCVDQAQSLGYSWCSRARPRGHPSAAEEEKAERGDHYITIMNYATRSWPEESKLSPSTKPFSL